MATYRRRFGDNRISIEFRVREGAATPIAKANVASTGEPVLVNGVPVEMPGADEQAALARAVRAVERVHGKMLEPKARKRKGTRGLIAKKRASRLKEK